MEPETCDIADVLPTTLDGPVYPVVNLGGEVVSDLPLESGARFLRGRTASHHGVWSS